ncbi:MAG: hypothetical protein SNF33_07010 [Candidatus Algichlamydia australiensis]|nr:hypothetical protein [Chlamydiales bacterium]
MAETSPLIINGCISCKSLDSKKFTFSLFSTLVSPLFYCNNSYAKGFILLLTVTNLLFHNFFTGSQAKTNFVSKPAVPKKNEGIGQAGVDQIGTVGVVRLSRSETNSVSKPAILEKNEGTDKNSEPNKGIGQADPKDLFSESEKEILKQIDPSRFEQFFNGEITEAEKQVVFDFNRKTNNALFNRFLVQLFKYRDGYPYQNSFSSESELPTNLDSLICSYDHDKFATEEERKRIFSNTRSFVEKFIHTRLKGLDDYEEVIAQSVENADWMEQLIK